jgi:hypothetical protein
MIVLEEENSHLDSMPRAIPRQRAGHKSDFGNLIMLSVRAVRSVERSSYGFRRTFSRGY